MESREELQRKIQETETALNKMNTIIRQLNELASSVQSLPPEFTQKLQNYVNKQMAELNRFRLPLMTLHDVYVNKLYLLNHPVTFKPNGPSVMELIKKNNPNYYNAVQQFNEAAINYAKRRPPEW